MKSYQQFFAELKRRHVFRVMAVYGVVAFIVLQVADLVFPILELPDWTLQFVLMLALLGFPITIVLSWAFDTTPEGVKRTEDATPEELDALITAPASQRLPAGLMALVGVVALVVGAYWVGTRAAADSGSTVGSTATDARLAFADLADDPRPSIAVLPFADMSPEGDQEYFSDGMTEEILNVLAKIRELRVSARTSAFAFRDSDLTAEQLGDTLHVTYVVEGSVRKSGDRLRITAQLIDTEDGSHLWSDQYDREMDDVFAIQTEIAEAIAEELRVPLGLNQEGQLVTPTGDLEAYDLYLAGRAQLRRRGASLTDAIRMFEAAIARDSSFAPAWAALAEAKETRTWYPEIFDKEDEVSDSVEVANSLAEAEHAATRALGLDPRNASAMVALGAVAKSRGRSADSEEFFRRALAVDPDDADAHQEYAEFLSHRGRVAEAVEFADRAAMLDPAPVRLFVLANSLELDDRMGEATDVLRLAMRQDPDLDYVSNWFYGAVSLARLGQTDEAIEAIERILLNPPNQSWGWLNAQDFSVWATSIAGNRFEDLPEGWPFDWLDLVAMGRPEDVVTSWVDGNWWASLGIIDVGWIWSPGLDSLRSEPLIQGYLESVGMADVRLQRTPVDERTRPMILGSKP